MVIKTKINKSGIIKLKMFCIAKGTINKVKRQLSAWENLIANETTDKKKNLQYIQAVHVAQYQKNKQPSQNMDRRPKQTFIQRRHTRWLINT